MGGGLHVGAVAGRADIMEVLNPETPLERRVEHTGNKVLKERNINGHLYSRTIVHFYLGPIDYEPSGDTMPPTRDI